MSSTLKLLRFFWALLALFAVGRWAMSLGGVPYEKGHQVFSLVILTVVASAHHAAFTRAWGGRRFWAAVGLGVSLALSAQVVILLSTVASYVLGLSTYFNTPAALNVTEPVELGRAIVIRLQGLFANSILNGIVAAIGFALGGLLPARAE